MANYQHKRSQVVGKVPLAGDLLEGEVAVNIKDRKLFSKDDQGVVFEFLGGNSGGVETVNGISPVSGNVTLNALNIPPTADRLWLTQAERQLIAGFDAYDKTESDDRYLLEANNLSDLTNAATARTNLGLGTASTRDVGESAGNLMEVGAFGLGTNPSTLPQVNVSDVDLNTFGTTGLYFCGPSSSLTNLAPDAFGSADYGYLTVIAGNIAGRICQEFTWSRYATNSNRKFIRTYIFDTGTWTPWQEVYTTGNILGTVSQSGGVPTGAIIERGSNVNGSYTKYADGTLLISIRATRTLEVSTSYGGLYRTTAFNVNLPTQIIPERTTVSGSFYDVNGNLGWILSSINNTTTQLDSLIAVGADNTASAARILDISIMSKWY